MEKEFKKLEEEMKGMPFDKALPILRQRLWEIAKRFETTGDQIFIKYMNWKANQ